MRNNKQTRSVRKDFHTQFRLLSGAAVYIGMVTLAAACAALIPEQAHAQNAPPTQAALVPQPERITWTASRFVLNPATSIVYVPAEGMLSDAQMLAEHLRSSTGYRIPVAAKAAGAAVKGDEIVLTTSDADPALGPQGYQLDAAASDVIIRAPSRVGVFYGAQTLRQLLPIQIESPTVVQGVVWQVPGVSIWDRPRFAERGIMLDSARHMQPVDYIKRTIDRMAYEKMNTFHWHLTDDEGWRIEIKQYPKLTAGVAGQQAGFYTQDQLRDIVAYAAERCVTIIPEVEMPSHDQALVFAYPELGAVASPADARGNWTADPLSPAKDSVYTFLDNVLTEVMAIFPSKVIHIGGDELNTEVWKTSPECQAFMQKEGLVDTAALKDYFTNRISTFVQSHGRRIEKWTDNSDGDNVPTNEVAEEWNVPQTALNDMARGNDVVVSAAGSLYFDQGPDTPTMQTVYEFDALTFLPATTPDLSQHVLGIEACLWTSDFATESACDANLWPRMVPLAIAGWSQPSTRSSWPDFKAAMLDSYYPRLALLGLGAPEPTAQLLLDLSVRSGFDWGSKVGAWSPDTIPPGSSTADFDITSHIQGNGLYFLRFVYTSGGAGIYIEGVDLLKNGTVAATYKQQEGWAGVYSHWSTYQMPLSDMDPSARYTVRVHFKTSGNSTDTAGDVWFQGPN